MFFSVFHCTRQIPKALGCKNNPLAYDITAACSGFVLGLVSASCHIRGNKLVYCALEEVPNDGLKTNTIKSLLYKLQEVGFVMF